MAEGSYCPDFHPRFDRLFLFLLMMILTKTGRGFPILNFQDSYGAECSLQASSIWMEDDNNAAGGSAVWLGVDDPKPQVLAKKLHPDDPTVTGWEPCPLTPPPGVEMDDVLFTTRMHLTREQVRELIGQLQHWLKHAEFKPTGAQ